MGYTTKFQGRLDFTHDVTVGELSALKAMFGEDCREHPEWKAPQYCHYLDLRLTGDFLGIEWDDATEKASDMADQLNVVIGQMRAKWPKFGLKGQLLAQGEDMDDRYYVVIGADGLAAKQKIEPSGLKVCCPECQHKFRVDATGKEV